MPCHWHVPEAAAASQVGGGSCKGLDIAASRDGNRLGQNAYEIMRRRNPSPSSRFPICYNLPVPRNAKPRPRGMPPAVVVACLMRITMLHRRFDPRQRPGPLDQRKKESKQTPRASPSWKPGLLGCSVRAYSWWCIDASCRGHWLVRRETYGAGGVETFCWVRWLPTYAMAY